MAAIFDALDAYDDLAEHAPRDLADDWDAVVDPLHALEDALEEHEVDATTYSAEEPPAGLDDEARSEIESAARRGRLRADGHRDGRGRAARARRLRHAAVALRRACLSRRSPRGGDRAGSIACPVGT